MAGFPKINVEFRGGLKAEGEGRPDANKRALGDGSTSVDTDFPRSPSLPSDEIERTCDWDGRSVKAVKVVSTKSLAVRMTLTISWVRK